MAGGQGVDRGVLPLPDDQLTPAGAPDLVLPKWACGPNDRGLTAKR